MQYALLMGLYGGFCYWMGYNRGRSEAPPTVNHYTPPPPVPQLPAQVYVRPDPAIIDLSDRITLLCQERGYTRGEVEGMIETVWRQRRNGLR